MCLKNLEQLLWSINKTVRCSYGSGRVYGLVGRKTYEDVVCYFVACIGTVEGIGRRRE